MLQNFEKIWRNVSLPSSKDKTDLYWSSTFLMSVYYVVPVGIFAEGWYLPGVFNDFIVAVKRSHDNTALDLAELARLLQNKYEVNSWFSILSHIESKRNISLYFLRENNIIYVSHKYTYIHMAMCRCVWVCLYVRIYLLVSI